MKCGLVFSFVFFISLMWLGTGLVWAIEEETARVRIIFLGESMRLPAGSRALLDKFLARVKEDDSGRRLIIVRAYAALPERPAWEAYRLSLDRALTIRDYLLRQTLGEKEIILKPLGNLCDDPCQRADIFLTKR